MLFKYLRGVLKMNDHRKKIIISEIKYWKEKKLLPAHYCDFLIMLYARGNESEEEEVAVSNSILSKEDKKKTMIPVGILLLATLLSAGLLTVDKYPILLLGLSGVCVMIFLLYPMLNLAIRRSTGLPLIYISSAMLLLIMSLKLWTTFFNEQPMLLIGLLIVNCSLWLFAGRFLKQLYFTISGSVGLLLIIAFLVI